MATAGEAELEAMGANPPDSWTQLPLLLIEVVLLHGEENPSQRAADHPRLTQLKFPSCKRWTCFPPNPLIHIPASPKNHTPMDQEWCVGTAAGRTKGDEEQKSQLFEDGPYLWGCWRSTPYLHKGKWREKLLPGRKDKIERMRHKSFPVYLLALYVIGWK